MDGQQPQDEKQMDAPKSPTVWVIASEEMGRGDAVLGKMLMRSHLHVLAEGPGRPDVLVLFNSGVKLATRNSDALEDLRALAEQGAVILLCGTCIGYYDLKLEVAVGEISNMHDITETLVTAGKVISL